MPSKICIFPGPKKAKSTINVKDDFVITGTQGSFNNRELLCGNSPKKIKRENYFLQSICLSLSWKMFLILGFS